MRLYSFLLNHRRCLGAEWQGQIVDLSAAYSIASFVNESGSDDLQALPGDVLAFIRLGPAAIHAAHGALTFVKKRPAVPVGEQLVYPLEQVKLLAPVRPGKILCCRRSSGNSGDFLISPKLPNTVIGSGDFIQMPRGAEHLEAELMVGAVISRTLKNATESDIARSIFGYTLINDLSFASSSSSEGRSLFMSKNFDSSCPIGPCLVSDEEFGEAGELSFRCSVNGRVVQSGTLSALKTRFNTVLSSISQTMTLTAGDVIGIAIEENGFLRLQAGDAVQFEVEEIGRLDNQVVLST